MDFGKIFSSRVIAVNYTENPENKKRFLGEALAPAVQKAGLDLSFLRGHRGAPISLAPCAFDAKAPIRERIAVTKVSAEMPFFRESFLLKEKDRQDILRAQDINDPFARSAIDFVFNDARDLLIGARVVRERMFWNVFAPADGKPKITIQENDQSYVYDYDPNTTFYTNNTTTLLGTSLWSASATADPIGDLRGMMDKVENASGTRPSRAVMSRQTFGEMIACTSFQNAMKAAYAGGYVLSDPTVIEFIYNALGLRIAVYNDKYRQNNAAKTLTQFVPDGVVSFMPDGIVGHTVMGTTPEEADAIYHNLKDEAQTTVVENGIAITVNPKINPSNIETIASEICLPSAERLDECGVLIV